jgi:hypothetical protein
MHARCLNLQVHGHLVHICARLRYTSACEFGPAKKDTHIRGAFMQAAGMELIAAGSVKSQLWMASIGAREHVHHVARKNQSATSRRARRSVCYE